VGSYDDDLRFAHVLADAADDITAKRFRALDLRVETKPDLTPVSDADRATEDSLRNILRRSRPRDAVLGEESGQTGIGPRRWVLDPIDATKNYVRGVPVWATLIGLMDGDEVVVGVVTAPALGRRWWASGGGRRLDRALADQGLPLPGLPGHEAVRRLVLLFGRRRLGGDRQARRVPRAKPGRVADPGIR
jgi:fructose-1,6-bisphosphatase/inositol monophosphatase family enzyme